MNTLSQITEQLADKIASNTEMNKQLQYPWFKVGIKSNKNSDGSMSLTAYTYYDPYWNVILSDE